MQIDNAFAEIWNTAPAVGNVRLTAHLFQVFRFSAFQYFPGELGVV
jgi:hypothetical protein